MQFHHLVVRARYGQSPLVSSSVCTWTWKHLSENFEDVAAAILMPDHIHLIAAGSPVILRDRLIGTIRWVTREFFPGNKVWESVPEPDPVRDTKHLLRQIRYVHLNPCRAGLVRDPLEWEWSTHRDWTGFAVKPWPSLGCVGWPAKGREERIHRYVSSDPTVAVSGTPLYLPKREIDLEGRILSARLVKRAVEIAYRGDGNCRTEAMQFMLRNSGYASARVAREFGITRQSLWRLGEGSPIHDATIKRILGDHRVLTFCQQNAL